jgi:hypothetical protein
VKHHHIAFIVICLAVFLDAMCGLVFAHAQSIPLWLGLYCALANAVTVGGTVAPSTHVGYIATAIECGLVVPLFAATFSLFTSALAGIHVRKSEARMKEHVEDRIRRLGGRGEGRSGAR